MNSKTDPKNKLINMENGIIKMQRKYRTLKSEINALNYSVTFQKDYLMSMINNLSTMNTLKLYQDTDSLFMSILNELNVIKKEIEKYPEIISIKNLNGQPENIYTKKNVEISNLLIKYSNHISSENVNYVLKLLIGEDWIDQFSKSDLEKILFITRFIKPVSVWDSEHHKQEIDYLPAQQADDSQKKASAVTKDIIESLLGIIPKNGNQPGDDKKSQEPVKINSIIINSSDAAMPAFLKTINDLIEMNPKKPNSKRINHYSRLDCANVLAGDNIKITKNLKSTTLIEDKIGACIYIKVKSTKTADSKFIVIQGMFKDDLLNISNSNKFVKDKYVSHKASLAYDVLTVPKYFKDNYLKTLSLRDIVVCTSSEIAEEVKKKFNDFKSLQGKPLLSLINEFLLASKYRKIDILTLLLMSNEEDQKLAYILFDVFKTKDKKDVSTEVYNSLHHSIREMLDVSKVKVEKDESELSKISESDIPYERRIGLMKTQEDVKAKAMEKLKSMKSSFQGDSKAQAWLDGLLKMPFGEFSQNEIISFKEGFIKKLNNMDPKLKLFSDSDVDNYIKLLRTNEPTNQLIEEWDGYKVDKKNYLREVRATLDSAVYGHKEAKVQLERIFAQWINGEAKGAVLGLQGPPGTGKTSLAKNGLSKCLRDKAGNPRPFAFLPIGGSVNGSTLVGHNFTYVGSTWGRIADILMVSGCMNPIIFIDEVDKVSHTEHGKEIISILTHMTDSTQNDEFEDKFFAGIKVDLSKALIVFSFNDPDLIDPILRDRITIIETHPLSLKEKTTIIKDYMFPEICKEVGFNKDEIILDEEIIKFMIETYTNEAGVRKIKEKIVEIVRDINLNRFHSDDYAIPFVVNKEFVQRLFENKPKVRVKKIHNKPEVGLVNGLYATASGIGGLTPVQILKFPSSKMLELNITGKAGEVMKESIEYSLKNAFSLLPKEKQDEIIEDANNKKSFGLHIHFPDGATPKDGPSAGLAITLAFYSMMSGIPVKNDVCMTGEIDLRGHAGIIGGLESKLHGGKKAGCTLALVPEDNMEDVERMRREGLSPEDDNFKVIAVSNIKEVLNYALVKN
jgi:ATP-dependent Lon protease